MGGDGRTIVVGMSGGVDSAVAAALLLQTGWRVVGVTMRQWSDPSGDPARGGCCSLAAVQEARRTCAELGIPHYTIDLQAEFEQRVVSPFVRDYASGRTPNPCTWCNVLVRFSNLMAFARRMGASRWATGHYARVGKDARTGYYQLLRGRCREKDQSYMLYRLTQEQLEGCVFPLGDIGSKEQTRAIAAELGLTVASRRDSQDICFVSDGTYREFLASRLGGILKPGSFVDEYGNVIGRHAGTAFYTIGQRRGLPASSRGPLYVLETDPETATVYVGPPERLYSRTLIAGEVVWTSGPPSAFPLAVHAAIRYNAVAAPARLHLDGSEVRCEFAEPQRAVTPGQAVVFYRGDCVVGGGVIRCALRGGGNHERSRLG